MRALDAGVTAAFASGEVALVTLVKLEFPSGTICLNSSTYDLAFGGDTYLAAYGLGRVSAVTDKPGDVGGLQLEIIKVDATMVALALDDADEVQGSVVTLRTAVLDSTTHQIIDAPLDWVGYADTMSIGEDGKTASIGVTAESKAVDLLRGNPLVYNDPDQQSLTSGDRYFEYVVSQADQPVVWPSRQWFFQ